MKKEIMIDNLMKTKVKDVLDEFVYCIHQSVIYKEGECK